MRDRTMGGDGRNGPDYLLVAAKLAAPVFLLVLVAVFATLDQRFVSTFNLFNILRQVSFTGLIAIGMTFVILTAGIDLSVGSLLALSGMAAAYERFLTAFRPVYAAVTTGRALSDLDALAVRVLLVHEYRRIVLRDPILPAEILPTDWPGAAARRLCAEIYTRVLPGAERWLDAHALSDAGTRLPRARDLRGRFAG